MTETLETPAVPTTGKGMKTGIKETLELMESLRICSVAGAKVSRDKKVTLSDIQYLVEMFKKMDVIVLGATGLGNLDEEWKDLDAVEAQQLLGRLLEIVRSVVQAFKGV